MRPYLVRLSDDELLYETIENIHAAAIRVALMAHLWLTGGGVMLRGKAATLLAATHALRLVRVDERNNCFVNYSAVTFGNPCATIGMYLRRAAVCGNDAVGSAYTIDFLNENGDIIDDVAISQPAARYLVNKLKLRVEQEAAQ